MAHQHDPEFQIRIIHLDGTEELTVWMTSEEQLTRAIARISTGRDKACWLRKRNVLCPECCDDQEQTIIVECPDRQHAFGEKPPEQSATDAGCRV